MNFNDLSLSLPPKGVSYKWCQSTDAGLPKPDLVVYLEWSKANPTDRNGYGEEVYENVQFQNKVKANYEKLKDNNWRTFDCEQGIDEVHGQIVASVKQVLKGKLDVKLDRLFTEML